MRGNARFWVWVNGDACKLTIEPGGSLHHWSGGRTEEGWSSEAERWRLSEDGETVERESTSDGRDCDGRLTQYMDLECKAVDLAAGHDAGDGVKFPAWERVSESQRDEYAEAAGY